jgi:hypothetical protein
MEKWEIISNEKKHGIFPSSFAVADHPIILMMLRRYFTVYDVLKDAL